MNKEERFQQLQDIITLRKKEIFDLLETNGIQVPEDASVGEMHTILAKSPIKLSTEDFNEFLRLTTFLMEAMHLGCEVGLRIIRKKS